MESTVKKPSALSTLNQYCRQMLASILNKIAYGTLTVEDSDGRWVYSGHTDASRVQAHIKLVNDDAYKAMAFGGSIGAAESYMSGDWISDNLTDVMRLMSLNINTINQIETGWAVLSKPMQYFYHVANKNTEKGSRRNIAAHYDLGNDLFKLFLDPTMMYSAAIFPTTDSTLEQASIYKLDRICKKLKLKTGDTVCEIGTGWGAFAIHAAKHYGCTVTTTTLSTQQHDYAQERIKQEGLEHKITLLKSDYRNLTGKFDKVVSIEMVEAVGHQYYDTYFQSINSLLKQDGCALIQAITLDHSRYQKAIGTVDFIQRYIFPGGCLPSTTALLQSASKTAQLEMTHMEDITPHYAKTLKIWRENFFKNQAAIRKHGYNEEFMRMWDYYFCYCEGGFLERVVGSVQLVFSKPLHRAEPVLGDL